MVNLDMLYKWTFHNFALEELTYFTLKHFFSIQNIYFLKNDVV